MIKYTTTTTIPVGEVVTAIGDAFDCGVNAHVYWDGAAGWTFSDAVTTVETCRATDSSETFDAGSTPPGGTFRFCRDTLGNDIGNASRITIGVEFLTDAGFYVRIPLEDYTGD